MLIILMTKEKNKDTTKDPSKLSAALKRNIARRKKIQKEEKSK